MPDIRISVNGQQKTVPSKTTIADLLTELGCQPEQTVVEHNGVVLDRLDVGRGIDDGDELVVFPMIAGGSSSPAAATVLDLIGQTPMVTLRPSSPSDAEILAKLECHNPGGSIKDRIALGMIEDAERAGKLKPGAVLIEPTSGNTGVGLAIVAAVRGYRLVLVMPDSMSAERRAILKHLGAQVVLTPGMDGMAGAVRECERMRALDPDMFCPSQFDNPANPDTHLRTTAEEIWRQTDGRLDAVVAGIGTGGTITGIARALKPRLPGLLVVGVEPAGSPILSGGNPGRHMIQGIGAGFVPGVLDRDLLDQIVTVSDDDAVTTARRLAQEEGLFVGISSGAAAWAARLIANRLGRNRRVVTILPDTGERYLSVESTGCNC